MEIIFRQTEATYAVELTESIVLRFDWETSEPLSLSFISEPVAVPFQEAPMRKDLIELDAVVGDSTGVVSVPLWNESIDSVEIGSTYTLKNGYTGLFKRNLRLNIGREGVLSKSEEEIEEVNTGNDMSAAEH